MTLSLWFPPQEIMVGSMYQAKIPPLCPYTCQERGKYLHRTSHCLFIEFTSIMLSDLFLSTVESPLLPFLISPHCFSPSLILSLIHYPAHPSPFLSLKLICFCFFQPIALRTSCCGSQVFFPCKKWRSFCCMCRDCVARRGRHSYKHKETLSKTTNRSIH